MAYDKVLSINPRLTKALLAKAFDLDLIKEYEKAIKIYDIII